LKILSTLVYRNFIPEYRLVWECLISVTLPLLSELMFIGITLKFKAMKTRSNNPGRMEKEEKRRKETGQEALDNVRTGPAAVDNFDGIVGERSTGANPTDSAGVSDIDATMRRGSRYSRRNS
jgi:hypothetical protein